MISSTYPLFIYLFYTHLSGEGKFEYGMSLLKAPYCVIQLYDFWLFNLLCVCVCVHGLQQQQQQQQQQHIILRIIIIMKTKE